MAWSRTQVSPEPCSAWPTSATAVLSPHDARREDGPLSGGTANRGLVIRVGDTVLRPTAPCWRATHALLAHLSALVALSLGVLALASVVWSFSGVGAASAAGVGDELAFADSAMTSVVSHD